MITTDGKNLILTLPLKQMSYDALEEESGEVDNLIGYSDGKEFSLNYLIDLAYKDSTQLGMPVIHFEDKEELEEVCKELNLDIWEYERCAICDKTLLGTHTCDSEGRGICEEHK